MVIKYKCNRCDNSISKLFYKNDKVPGFLSCGVCGGILEKELPSISVSSVEVVDNGAMAKKVELRKDAVRRHRERGDLHIKNLTERERILKKDED